MFDFCSPLDGLCKLTSMHNYQARLLNINRYFAAFVALRDPLHLPAEMRTDGQRSKGYRHSPCRYQELKCVEHVIIYIH